jgi:hypothetical protein
VCVCVCVSICMYMYERKDEWRRVSIRVVIRVSEAVFMYT